MASDRGSILALDSFTSEESIRVAAYDRAIALSTNIIRAPAVVLIASDIVNFISGERWRLEAFDVALKHAGMPNTVEVVFARAEEIIKWVSSEKLTQAESDPVPDGGPVKSTDPVSEPTIQKKSSTRRKR